MDQVNLVKTNQEKLVLWQNKLKQIEEVDLPKARQRLGESVESGDWHENAEYEDAERQIEILQARIDDIKVMIMKLKKGNK